MAINNFVLYFNIINLHVLNKETNFAINYMKIKDTVRHIHQSEIYK